MMNPKGQDKKPKPRGFAAMSEEKRRAIAALGGKAAQKSGKAHKWSRREAIEAGRQGGLASQKSGKANRFDSKTGAKAARKRRRR